jgi:prepilin-type N-terminal cleavage/methylation domain-containing protein
MKRRGFTLIELLIVVAIIAILAAIAVPNFLEAQVRAKISRVKSDMRSVATAEEAYCVDYNMYADHYTNGVSDSMGFSYVQYMMVPTTPVAYITRVMLRDPFTPEPSIYALGLPPGWAKTYWSVPYQGSWGQCIVSEFGYTTSGLPKAYVIHSYGPDRIQGTVYNSSADTAGMSRFPFYLESGHADVAWRMIYDATNGTTSLGDIGRFGGSGLKCPLMPGW